MILHWSNVFLLYFRLGFGVCCVIFQRRKLPSFIPSSNLGIPQRRKQTRCQMTSWLSPWWRRWGLVPLFPLGVTRSRGPACFSSEIHRCGEHPRQPPSVLLFSVSPRNSHPRFPVFCLFPPSRPPAISGEFFLTLQLAVPRQLPDPCASHQVTSPLTSSAHFSFSPC